MMGSSKILAVDNESCSTKTSSLAQQQRWCSVGKITLLILTIGVILVVAVHLLTEDSEDDLMAVNPFEDGEAEQKFVTLSIGTEDSFEWGKISEDLIDHVEVFDEEAHATIIDTLQDWINARKQSLGIEASFAGIFSGSVHFEHEIKSQKMSNEHFINAYTTISRAVKKATISVDTFLDKQNSPELKGRLLNLTDEQSHWNFFRQFGSHYLCFFESGGQLILSATLKTHEISDSEKEDLRIDLESSFQYKLFSGGRSTSFEFHNEENYKKHVSDSMTQLHVLGGNPELVVQIGNLDLAHANESTKAFEKWVASIKDTPVTISHKFCPLGDFFTTRGEFTRAANFLEHLRSFLLACPSAESSSSCSENGLCDFNTFTCRCVDQFSGDDCTILPKPCENTTHFVPEPSFVGLLHPDGSGSYYDSCKSKTSGECYAPAADSFCIAKGDPNGSASFHNKRAMVETKTFDGTIKPAQTCHTGDRCIHCCHCLIRKRRIYQPIMEPCNFIFTSIDCKIDAAHNCT